MIGRKKLQVIKKLWFLMGQPCGKRMAAQLAEWLAFYAADEGVEYENVKWVLGISVTFILRHYERTEGKNVKLT